MKQHILLCLSRYISKINLVTFVNVMIKKIIKYHIMNKVDQMKYISPRI